MPECRLDANAGYLMYETSNGLPVLQHKMSFWQFLKLRFTAPRCTILYRLFSDFDVIRVPMV
jgi:hypothetical protein